MAERLQGKVVEWNDERGFGFVLQHGAHKKVFLHHSDVEAGRPRLGDIVTFVISQGDRGPKTAQVQIVGIGNRSAGPRKGDGRSGGNWFSLLTVTAVICAIVWAAWGPIRRTILRYQSPTPQPMITRSTERAPGSTAQRFSSSYVCDGRTHCSQMKSCEEAKFFINNCPGTKMDGNNDGIPCETTLCR